MASKVNRAELLARLHRKVDIAKASSNMKFAKIMDGTLFGDPNSGKYMLSPQQMLEHTKKVKELAKKYTKDEQNYIMVNI